MADPRTFKQSKVYAWIQVAQLNDTSDDGGGGAGTGISNSRTSITVDAAGLTPGSSHHIENGMDLLIESEQVTVSGVDGNTITIDRAEYGTSAAAHLDNVAIYAWKELKDSTSGGTLIQSILIKDDLYYPRLAQLVVSNFPSGDNYSTGVLEDVLKNNTPIKIIDGANYTVHFTGTITSTTKQHGMQAGNTIQVTAEDALYELARSKLQGGDRTLTLKDGTGAQTNADFTVALSKKISHYIEKLIQRFQYKGISGSENNLTTTETSSGSYTRFNTSIDDQIISNRLSQITFTSTDATILKAIQRLALKDRIGDGAGTSYGYVFYTDPNITNPSTAHKPAQMFNYYRSSFMPQVTGTTKDTAPSTTVPATGSLGISFKYPTSAGITEDGDTILMQPGASFDELNSERINVIVARIRNNKTGHIEEVQFELFHYTSNTVASQTLQSSYSAKDLVSKAFDDGVEGVEDSLRREDDSQTDWDARLVLDGSGSDEPLVGYLQYMSSTNSGSAGTYTTDGHALISSTRTNDADELVSPGSRLYINKVSEGNYLTLTDTVDPDALDIYRPQQVHEQKRAITMDFGIDDNPDNIRTAVAARFAQMNTPKQRGRFQCRFYPYHSFETQVAASGEIATASVGSKTKVTFTDDHSSGTTSRGGVLITQNGQIGLRAGHVIAKLTGQDGTVDTYGYLEKVTDTTAIAIMNSGSISGSDHIRYYIPLRAGHMIQADAAHHGVSSANGTGQQLVTGLSYYESGGEAYTDIETLAVPSAGSQTVISATKPDFISIDDQNDDNKDGDTAGFEFAIPHFTGTFIPGTSGTTDDHRSFRYTAGNLYIGNKVYEITAGTSSNSDGNGAVLSTASNSAGDMQTKYVIYFEPAVNLSQFQIKTEAVFENRNASDGASGTHVNYYFPNGRNRIKLGMAEAAPTTGGKVQWIFSNMTTGFSVDKETGSTARTSHSPDFKIGGDNLNGVGPASDFVPIKDDTGSLGVSGTAWTKVWSNSADDTSSDKRLKENIEPTDFGLEFINKLKPSKYNRKKSEETEYGLIAQDIEQILKDMGIDPENLSLISGVGTERLGLGYTEFISPLIKAIQELSDKVEKLENEGEE